ncbi:MAG: XRE family transcriptional regulator [Cytophagales bacterium]
MEKESSLGFIGKKINEIRKAKGLNMKTVAEGANISMGLLSKIENFRTMPSLPVLLSISKALEVNLADLVEDVNTNVVAKTEYLLVRKDQGMIETREDSKGLVYRSLVSTFVNKINIRANIVTINPNVYREPLSTNGMELVHVLSGSVYYGIGNEQIRLEKGDTLYFDGNIPHSVENKNDIEAMMFKIYFINQE